MVERPRPTRRVFVVSRDEDEREACDLGGTFVHGLLDAVFGGSAVAFQPHAALGEGFKVLGAVGIARSSSRVLMKLGGS